MIPYETCECPYVHNRTWFYCLIRLIAFKLLTSVCHQAIVIVTPHYPQYLFSCCARAAALQLCVETVTSISSITSTFAISTPIDSCHISSLGACGRPKYFKCYVPTPRAAASTNKHREFMINLSPCTRSGHCNVQAHTASGWMGDWGLYIGWAYVVLTVKSGDDADGPRGGCAPCHQPAPAPVRFGGHLAHDDTNKQIYIKTNPRWIITSLLIQISIVWWQFCDN